MMGLVDYEYVSICAQAIAAAERSSPTYPACKGRK
jgi:hypothetical protein